MNIHEEYMKKHGLKESDFDNMPEIWNALNSVQEIFDKHEGKAENLPIADVSNCKTEPRLNKLETELDKLQKVHGEIINLYEVHNGCTGFKFKDGSAYRVKLERSFGKATLD